MRSAVSGVRSSCAIVERRSVRSRSSSSRPTAPPPVIPWVRAFRPSESARRRVRPRKTAPRVRARARGAAPGGAHRRLRPVTRQRPRSAGRGRRARRRGLLPSSASAAGTDCGGRPCRPMTRSSGASICRLQSAPTASGVAMFPASGTSRVVVIRADARTAGGTTGTAESDADMDGGRVVGRGAARGARPRRGQLAVGRSGNLARDGSAPQPGATPTEEPNTKSRGQAPGTNVNGP